MIVYEEFRSFLNYETFTRDDENLAFGMHLHNSFELLYVSRGEVLVTVDEVEHSIKAGEAILILPNRIHGYRTPKESKSTLFIFASNYINTFYQRVRGKSPLRPVFLLDEDIVNELKVARDTLLLKSLLYKVAYVQMSQTEFVERKNKGADTYGRILTFISQHYTENITAKDIAHQLGYDHRYVTSLIKKGLRSTFRRLLNEYRISHAQYLLSTEPKTISQIAYECGYDSLCSFNRNFKEITGITPKEFREKS
ncbi:MAG: helix-turn-helix transcriptional regulator [Clostridia bacterium]|nr:helix-turn-helix transcriptional regulator [Clostridia bacterium]MBQ7907778.1 helix-turn-helix transcriptional regulator [Clostridia bacterium]